MKFEQLKSQIMKLSHVSPLCMFEQNCPSWWNGIILVLLPGKRFKTCFVQGKRCCSLVVYDG